MFVVDRQLFGRLDRGFQRPACLLREQHVLLPFARMRRLAQRVPQRDGARVVEFALRHLRQFALREPLDGTRQAGTQRALVQLSRARGMAAAAHHAGEARAPRSDRASRHRASRSQIRFPASSSAKNPSRERRQAAQVHLVVAENSRERLGGPSAQVIEIHLRDQRRIDVIVAGPFEGAPAAREDVALQVLQAHRTEPQPPELARGMQQIQMHLGRKGRHAARHAVARFEQWPVEAFTIERHQHGPLLHALGEFEQQRMLFIEIAHEELLDLQAARIPPRDADQKRIRAGASGKAGRFRVQKQPLFGVERGPEFFAHRRAAEAARRANAHPVRTFPAWHTTAARTNARHSDSG